MERPDEQQPNDQESPGARILVVDDEKIICDVCARTLRRGGYIVHTLGDPLAAAELLRSGENFDLLLTDIAMPAMSGLDLAQIARDVDPAISIIIMTGFASVEYLQRSVKRGIADFLAKPFEIEHLRLAVTQALQRRTILRENLRLRTIAHLLDDSEAINATLDLDTLVSKILDSALRQGAGQTAFVLLPGQQHPLAGRHDSAAASITPDGLRLAQRAMHDAQTVVGKGLAFAHLGNTPLLHALATPLRAQGTIIGGLVVCDDRASVERPGVHEALQLLANQAGTALRNALLYRELDAAFRKLADLDRTRNEFITIAAHELRTPLSIVLGYTMMLRDQMSGDQREYLTRAYASAERIKEVVDDMVNLRFLDTGEVVLTPEQVDLQAMITESVAQLATELTASAHGVVLDVPDEPVLLVVDREKLQNVLRHLLTNAIKFTRVGGQITVSLRTRSSEELLTMVHGRITRLGSQMPWIVMAVGDTGIGIAPDEQVRIFDRFYQVADSLTRDRGGIGLGLSIVRDTVEALGGMVWVQSREGEGSTFYIALPHEEPASQSVGE